MELLADGLLAASGNMVTRTGDLLQAEFDSGRIMRVDRQGEISVFAEGGMVGPVGLTYGPGGHVYVADCLAGTVVRVPANGGTAEPFARYDLFNCPNGITAGPDGNLYMVDNQDTYVFRITPDGETSVFAHLPGVGHGHITLAGDARQRGGMSELERYFRAMREEARPETRSNFNYSREPRGLKMTSVGVKMMIVVDDPGRMRLAAMLSASVLLLSACAQGTGREAPDTNASDEAAAVSLAELSEWEAVSSGGSTVKVLPAPTPVRPGPVSFEIVLETDPGRELPLSVDIASPAMPMHGIRRYPSTRLSATRYRVDAEIPMDGAWAVYVNLDEGTDAVGFELEVPAVEGQEGHQHHQPGDADAPEPDPEPMDRGAHSEGAGASEEPAHAHDN